MAVFVSLPLVLGAAPTLKVTTPTRNPTTNGVLDASGTATGVAPLSVFYSLNGGAWTAANGSNNWSATNLLLTASTNTFSAYAQDANGVSKTNTVKFIYVVKLPISVEITGQGKVSPITNGEPLEIGKKYSVSFKAARGFGVGSATLDGNAIPVTTRSLVMESNTVLAVTFRDITKPVCVITFPAVKHSVSNSPINVTGKASDNVGVTAVNYQLNGGGWNPAILTDPTNWEADGLALNVGTNVVQAFAQDAAGNVSLTNTVNFTYVSNAPAAGSGPAPASISGNAGQVTIDGDPGPFQVDFGTTTFAQTSTNGQEKTKAGTYTYTLLSSNMAELVFTTLLPPSDTGGGGGVVLTFTNDTTAIFTNNGNGSNGVITLAQAPNLAISPSATGFAQSVDSGNNTNTFLFGGGLFTNTDGVSYTNFGTYTVTAYSPQDVVFTESLTDPQDISNTAYVQLDFSSTTNGLFSYNQFDNMGNLLSTNAGTFTVLQSGSQPVGNAPDSPEGSIWTANPVSGAGFQFCFGASTYSRSDTRNTNNNDVGVYSYVKTGPNTAQFQDFETEPQSGGFGGNGGGELIDLTFSSSRVNVTNNGNYLGFITFSAAKNLAPASLAGKTLTAFGGTAVFNQDGTVTFSQAETYTYTQFSPEGGMVVAINPSDGSINYLELTFTSATGGDIFLSAFSSTGNLNDTKSGTFTLK